MNKEFIAGKKRILVYILFVILGFLLFSVISFAIKYQKIKILSEEKKAQKMEKDRIESQKKERESKKEDLNRSLNKIVEAQSFILINLTDNEIIFKKNENRKLGVASLTKIATADVSLSSAGDDKKVKINFFNLQEIGDNGLVQNETFSVYDLVKFMMVVSSNDAASALTNSLGKENFIERMNYLAEKLSLKSTLFFTESGLNISKEIAGAYSTAVDVAKLTEYFYKKYPALSEDFSQGVNSVCSKSFCHKIENSNKLLLPKKEKDESTLDIDKKGDMVINSNFNQFPYKVLFSKTGFTEKTGGALSMIVKINEKEVLAVVLKSGENSRFSDIKILFDNYKNFLEKNN